MPEANKRSMNIKPQTKGSITTRTCNNVNCIITPEGSANN